MSCFSTQISSPAPAARAGSTAVWAPSPTPAPTAEALGRPSLSSKNLVLRTKYRLGQRGAPSGGFGPRDTPPCNAPKPFRQRPPRLLRLAVRIVLPSRPPIRSLYPSPAEVPAAHRPRSRGGGKQQVAGCAAYSITPRPQGLPEQCWLPSSDEPASSAGGATLVCRPGARTRQPPQLRPLVHSPLCARSSGAGAVLPLRPLSRQTASWRRLDPRHLVSLDLAAGSRAVRTPLAGSHCEAHLRATSSEHSAPLPCFSSCHCCRGGCTRRTPLLPGGSGPQGVCEPAGVMTCPVM